jgi:predicted Rossmann fold nucleotide-binding protein DprA/Smf involved in DNA uptake
MTTLTTQMFEEAYRKAWEADAARYRARVGALWRVPVWVGKSRVHRGRNREAVLAAVKEHWTTRAEMEAETGLTAAQVSNSLYYLTISGHIEKRMITTEKGPIGQWRMPPA